MSLDLVPHFSISDHDVEYGDEFSHGGNEGDHFWFSFFEESVVEVFDDRIVFCGDECGHEECVSNADSSATGGSFSSERSAVPVGGCDSDEPCNLFSVEAPEFGQLRDQPGDGNFPQTRCGANDCRFLLCLFVLFDEFVERLLNGFELTFIKADRVFDHVSESLVDGAAQPVIFLGNEFADLFPPGSEVSHFLLKNGDRRCDARLHCVCKSSDNASVNIVRFCKLSSSSGEVSNLSGIDDADLMASLVQRADQSPFEPSGRFQTNVLWLVLLEQLQQFVQPSAIVLKCG